MSFSRSVISNLRDPETAGHANVMEEIKTTVKCPWEDLARRTRMWQHVPLLLGGDNMLLLSNTEQKFNSPFWWELRMVSLSPIEIMNLSY
ncbi:hypothetical protein NPIL_563461 [Nephila pilipes]|uniref:Uncharacterized protein n=1 Tax=Nephila pilipes TaxID=299642 RepID=A0A8X6QTU6_NEPPI|nr:hypothetical protein NPIL_563461 [Nephila pilipes]